MPFKPSSSPDFEADATWVNGFSNIDEAGRAGADSGATWRTSVVDAFVEYQARDDIESRDSILARENAQPGSIHWEAQTNPNEVDVVTEPTPPGP